LRLASWVSGDRKSLPVFALLRAKPPRARENSIFECKTRFPRETARVLHPDAHFALQNKPGRPRQIEQEKTERTERHSVANRYLADG
jgi:hypothetical protein